MPGKKLVFVAAVWLALGSMTLARAPQTQPASAVVASTEPASVLQRYCVTCHNDRLRTAGLALDGLDAAHPESKPDVWEKVIRRLRSRTMPPLRVPRPDEATYDRLAAALEASLDRAAVAQPHPSRPLLHRMNRAEYRNAVRDLLALDVDVSAL